MNDTPDLVRRARDGDRRALEALVARHDRYVLSVALLTLGDRDAAQDAAQEALIKAMRGLKGFKADVLSSNKSMLKVFEKSGLAVEARVVDGVYELNLPFSSPAENRSG